MASTPADGLFVRLLKIAFRARIWDVPHQLTVRFFLYVTGRLDHDFNNDGDAESAARWAMDCYTAAFSILLIALYFFCYGQYGEPRGLWFWTIYVSSIVVATFRTVELLAVIASLHLPGPYRSSAPIRALVLGFICYIHIITAFAILYLTFGDLIGDTFAATSAPTIAHDWVTPLYFSFVTVTTLGFGDLRPNHWLDKLLVILQVLIGIVFVVVIFQRTIAATQKLGVTTNGDTHLNGKRPPGP